MEQERGMPIPYWESFVGAGWVLERIKGQPIYASDANFALIEMWKALQNGWIPPDVVTEEMYQEAKDGKYDPALTAFIGFGCSFAGKWFAGNAKFDKRSGRDYAKTSAVGLLKKYRRITKTQFFCADFLECPAPAYSCLIYADIPYLGAEPYDACPPFDHALFWQHIRYLEGQGHTCVISEYQAPPDFSCVLEMVTKTDMHTRNGKDRRVERLFRLGEYQLQQPRLF